MITHGKLAPLASWQLLAAYLLQCTYSWSSGSGATHRTACMPGGGRGRRPEGRRHDDRQVFWVWGLGLTPLNPAAQEPPPAGAAGSTDSPAWSAGDYFSSDFTEPVADKQQDVELLGVQVGIGSRPQGLLVAISCHEPSVLHVAIMNQLAARVREQHMQGMQMPGGL